MKHNPNAIAIGMEFWIRDTDTTALVYHKSDTASPAFQDLAFIQDIRDNQVLRFRIMPSEQFVNGHIWWKRSAVLNLHTVIIDGNSYRTSGAVIRAVGKDLYSTPVYV